MPRVTIHVRDAESKEPILDQGVYVSIQQDKFLEGFKEIARLTPHPATGQVSYEAASLTKYRIVGDGSKYHSNELIIDTGFNFAFAVEDDLFLERKLIPTPDLDIAHYVRDIGLAQLMPVVLIAIAAAAIIAGLAYVVSKGSGIAKALKGAKAAATPEQKEKQENAST